MVPAAVHTSAMQLAFDLARSQHLAQTIKVVRIAAA